MHPTGLAGVQLCVRCGEMHFHDLSCLHRKKKKEKSTSLHNIEDQCETELSADHCLGNMKEHFQVEILHIWQSKAFARVVK